MAGETATRTPQLAEDLGHSDAYSQLGSTSRTREHDLSRVLHFLAASAGLGGIGVLFFVWFWRAVLDGYIAPMDGKWPAAVVWFEHYVETPMLAGTLMLILVSLRKTIKGLKATPNRPTGLPDPGHSLPYARSVG